jgi:hypothetical protein
MDRQKALEDSAQGFNPENPENKRFALKGARGYQMSFVPIVSRK